MPHSPAKNGTVKKATKTELLELANFLYSRYEHKKKTLNKPAQREIINMDTNHDTPNG